MKLRDIDEFELISRITDALGAPPAHTIIGPGDDCAAVAAPEGALVTTCDMLVEGVDFDLSWISWRDLGRRVVEVNVSDVAAMGASPGALFVTVALTGDEEVDWIEQLAEGMGEAAKGHGAAVLGGDLSSTSGPVVISVTVNGSAPRGALVTRGGAKPGDLVVAVGALGLSGAGLSLLMGKGHAPPDVRAALLDAHLRPRALVEEGRLLAAAGATAMIDVSDGLAADLGHVARASGCKIRLDAPSIPLDPALAAWAPPRGVERLDLVLGGGEDFALAVTIPPRAWEPIRTRFGHGPLARAHVLGAVEEGSGLWIARDGREEPLLPKGWVHFGRS